MPSQISLGRLTVMPAGAALGWVLSQPLGVVVGVVSLATGRSNTACGFTSLYSGWVGDAHEMLRECAGWCVSVYEFIVEQPTCSDGSVVALPMDWAIS